MPTRPLSIRRKHQRIQRKSLVIAIASVSWLMGGSIIGAALGTWWALAFVAVGIVFGLTALAVMRPKLRRAEEDLAALEQLSESQKNARVAQAEAIQRAFRAPIPSSTGV